jgi:hypothetical protein
MIYYTQWEKTLGFLYETIDTYIKDAQNANKSDLVETWQNQEG